MWGCVFDQVDMGKGRMEWGENEGMRKGVIVQSLTQKLTCWSPEGSGRESLSHHHLTYHTFLKTVLRLSVGTPGSHRLPLEGAEPLRESQSSHSVLFEQIWSFVKAFEGEMCRSDVYNTKSPAKRMVPRETVLLFWCFFVQA